MLFANEVNAYTNTFLRIHYKYVYSFCLCQPNISSASILFAVALDHTRKKKNNHPFALFPSTQSRMEPVGAFPDGEWDCFRGMFASEDHFTSEFPLLLGGGDELNIVTEQANFCGAPEAGENELMFYSLDAHNSNSSQYISQESSYSNSSNCSGDDTVFIANPGSSNYYFSYPDHMSPNNACVYSLDEKHFAPFAPSLPNIATEESVKLYEDLASDRLENSECNQMEPIVFPTKRKIDVPADGKINNRSENHKKKPRVSKDVSFVSNISY